jgi:uncharacterized membrane protein YdjX (TVP38/TMEM64 family)/SAM-dependent methyltransferase
MDFASLRRDAGGTLYLAALWSIVPAIGFFLLLAKIAPMAEFLNSHGSFGIAIYAALFAVAAGCGLTPTNAQAVLGGWVFGFQRGSLGALAGVTFGAIIGFAIARLVSQQQLRALVDRHPRAAIVRRALLDKSGFRALGILTLLRIPPNMPFAMSNLAMASAGAKFVPYTLGALFGMAPRTILTVYFAARAASTGAKDIQDFAKSGEGKLMLLAGLVVLFFVIWVIQRIGSAALEKALPAKAGEPKKADAWWSSAFDRSYLERYAHRDDAEAKRMLDTFSSRVDFGAGRVLDLCCGAGRHSAELKKRGAKVVGLDFSRDLLAAGHAREPALDLLRGDMRRLPIRTGSLAGVIQLFTAFGYFEQDADNRAVLAEVARVLRPSGFYVLDLFNREPVLAALTGATERKLPDGTVVFEERRFDAARKRIEKTMRHGEETRFESVRVFDEIELREWFSSAGLDVERVLGDYDGGAYGASNSPRMIFVARRTG